jgi:hypothetical protein
MTRRRAGGDEDAATSWALAEAKMDMVAVEGEGVASGHDGDRRLGLGGKLDMGGRWILGKRGETGRLLRTYPRHPGIFLAEWKKVLVLHAGSSCFHISRGASMDSA